MPEATTRIQPYHEARAELLAHFDRVYLRAVVAAADGVMTRAAELAGVDRATLYRMKARVEASRRGWRHV